MLASSSGGGASNAQTPSPVQSSRLIVGVVRGDGILLPLASRENEAWTDPEVISSATATRAVQAPGRAARPARRMDLCSVGRWCFSSACHQGHGYHGRLLQRQEGFATNAPKPGPKLDAPHLMSGIAIHGNVSAVPVEDVVRQPDDASRRVARFIVQLTHALEAERASVPPKSPRTTIPSNERGHVPVQITTLARDRVVGDSRPLLFRSSQTLRRCRILRKWMAYVVAVLRLARAHRRRDLRGRGDRRDAGGASSACCG